MTPVVLSAVTDEDIVALTLFGEARGEGPEGRIAVANVIRNRVGARTFGETLRAVCLKPKQFSCWIEAGGASNYSLLMDTARTVAAGGPIGPVLRECRWIARGLFANEFVDNTRGATHYLTLALIGSRPPAWARNQRVLVTLGAHAFLRVL